MELSNPDINLSIIPSAGPVEKVPPAFRDAKFWISQISEYMNLNRFFFYELERKDPSFQPEKVKAGNSERRLYNWQQIGMLIDHYGVLHPQIVKKVKTFANIKGGVGKSTLASQVAMLTSLMGYKTLCIDLDPQAHLTLALGRVFVDLKKPTISHYWFNKPPVPIEYIIQMVTPFLGLIPSNLTLSSLDNLLFMERGRETYLKDLIDQIKDQWDVIIIDTNPSESIVNINAIIASDELCVPCKTDFFSVDGMSHLFNVLSKLMTSNLVTKLKIQPTVKVIPNLYDIRDGIAQESLGALRHYYGKYLSSVVVNKNTDISESQKLEQSIYQYNRSSTGFKDIIALTKELITGEAPNVTAATTV